MPELLDDGMASLTLRDYVCSNCWGHLVAIPAEGRKWRVECAKCGNETKGYVTKFYAQRRQSESIGDKLDVQINLRGILPPTEIEEETVEELLKGLGF